ncbi:MAG: hypothetical protein ACI9SG_000562 [Maribacter sp.]
MESEYYFSDGPNTWHVVVDIQNSTQAVDEGKQHQINQTTTGAIISVLNTIRKRNNALKYLIFLMVTELLSFFQPCF